MPARRAATSPDIARAGHLEFLEQAFRHEIRLGLDRRVEAAEPPPVRAGGGFFFCQSGCVGSIQRTSSGGSAGSMSRFTATAWPSLRTSTHSSTSVGLALISWCGTNGGT